MRETSLLIALLVLTLAGSGCGKSGDEDLLATCAELRRAVEKGDVAAMFELMPPRFRSFHVEKMRHQILVGVRRDGVVVDYSGFLGISPAQFESLSPEELAHHDILARLRKHLERPEYYAEVSLAYREADRDQIEHLSPDHARVVLVPKDAASGKGPAVPLSYEFILVGGVWYWRPPLPFAQVPTWES